jgi:hypothetical protein
LEVKAMMVPPLNGKPAASTVTVSVDGNAVVHKNLAPGDSR